MVNARRLAILAVLLVAASATHAAGAAATRNVTVEDNSFQPQSVVIERGDTVLWTQTGNLPHSVTADDGTFDSHPACSGAVPGSCMGPNQTYSRVFDTAGTFRYFCKVHGGAGGAGMAGVVQVVNELGVVPSTVLALGTSTSTSGLRISGSAAFGGVAAQQLGTDVTGDGAQNHPAILGFDLVGAKLGQPNPDTGELVFTLDAADLPPTGGVPQMANYAWDLMVTPVAGGPTRIRVVGSLTNVVASTNSPHFTISKCDASALCGQGIPISATMDGETNRVTATVPLASLQQLIAVSPAGATISGGDFGFTGAAVYATPSANAIGPPQDEVELVSSYAIGSRTVEIGVVPAGAPAAFDRTATLQADGSFSLTIPPGQLGAGAHDVWARACFGSNCGQRSTRVTL